MQTKGLSGSALKKIAVIFMFIDHIGFVIIEKIMDLTINSSIYSILKIIDLIFRLFGRLAFPIFCFLLVEGFIHTSNLKKYICRLSIFALLSEIPFNLVYGSIFYIKHQNVFFTLLTGIIAISFLQRIKKLYNGISKISLMFIVIVFFAFIAEICRFDYGAVGLICICILYLFRQNKVFPIIIDTLLLILLNPLEMIVILDVLIISLYNGKKGRTSKWFFYLFYPIHLLVLSGISYYVCNFVL